jgi:PKD repeat protein
MKKRRLSRQSTLAATLLLGFGLTLALLLLLGAWADSVLAAPPASGSRAPALNATAGITVVKAAPATVYQALGAGQTNVPYTLTIQNPSSYAIIPDAVVTDALPAGTTLLAGTTGPDWSGVLPPSGSAVTYTLVVTKSSITIDVGGYLASLAVPVRDGTILVNNNYCFSGTVNSTARAFCENVPVTTVVRAPDFGLVELPSAPVCAGGSVTYTINVNNPGGVRTTDIFTITGQITSGLSVLPGTISDSGDWTPPNITWDVATILLPDGGNQVTRTFAATIPGSTPHGTFLTNTYTVTSPEVLPNVAFWQSSGVTVTRPTAAFTTTAPACQNYQVAFHNSSFGTTSYEWDFGDGSPISTDTNPTHAYAGSGTYTVILTATGACGMSVTTDTVTVYPLPTPVLQIDPDPTQLGVTTYFTDAGSLGAWWDWSFGDGGTDSTFLPNTSHTYTGVPGNFTVILTSTAGTGCYSVTSRLLQVDPGAPYTVSLDAWPVQTPVGTSSAVTATVTDQWGNPVLDGTAIDFTALPPPAVIAPSSDPTSGGLAHATVTSTLAGPVTVRGTAPNSVFGTTVVTFTPGAPYTLTLVVSPLSLPVGNGAALTATVVDAYSNPIPGQMITFTVSGNLGSGALAPQIDAADGLGQVHATVTSTLPGLKAITATATASVWDTVVVTFTAGAPYTITLVANPLTPTVGSSAALTATVTDQFGNLALGEVISFTTADDLGLGDLAPDADTTDAAGEAHASVSSTSAGPKTITATASNLVSATVVVDFQAGPPASILLAAVPSTQTVGLSSQLRAQVRDQYLNVVASEVVSFTTSDDLGLGSILPITDTTSAFGWAYADIMSTLPGPKLVVATASNLVTGTTVITFVAGSPYSLTLDALPTTLQVGNTSALTATLTDLYANPLPSYVIVLNTVDPLGLGALTPLSGTTDAAGQVTSALSSTLPGVKIVTATQDGLTATALVTFTVGDPFTVTLVGVPDTLTVGQNAALTATVTDRFSNPIPDRGILFGASNLGLGGIDPLLDLTDNNGQAFSIISSTVAGSRLVQAWDVNANITGTTTITWTPGPPTDLTLVADPISLTVGNTSNLTATLSDQYGNPLAGSLIDFTYSGALGGGSLSPAADATGAVGEAHAAISSTVSGSKLVTATSPTGLTGTVTITFYPDVPTAVILVADPLTPTVGTSAALTATVVDQYSNVVPGQVVTFTHGGALGLGGLAPVTGTTDAAGQTTSAISSTLPGLVPLTATIANGISGTASVTFVPGAPYTLTLVADPTSLSVGNTAALTATLTDRFANPLSGYTVAFETTDPLGAGALSPLSNATDAAGEATSAISSTLTGFKTITATTGGLTATTQVEFTPGGVTTVTLVADPDTLPVGSTSTLTATATDQYGNPIPGLWIVFTSSGNPPSPAGDLTDSNGEANSSIGSALLGTVAVTATEFLSGVYGTTTVTFTVGAPVSMTLVADPTEQTVGGTSVLTATLYDQYGNRVPDYTVFFTTTDDLGLGSLAPLSDTTDAAGEATSAINATLIGVKTITATSNGLTATAQVTFSVGALATIVVTPDPVTVTVGATQPFTATGYDQYSNPVPITPTWTTNGGSIGPGPGANTTFTAQTTPASGRLVTATQGAISGTAVVNIVHGSAVTLDVAPAAATIAAGSSQPYTVTAYDTYNNPWDVTASSAYTITPGAGGTWTANSYTGEIAGTWTVTATYLTLNDTAVLTVTHAPTAVSAALSPNPYTVGAGGAVAYTLIATDTYGNAWDATASGAYAITPAAGGSWAANVYTSEYTGTWTVTGTVPSAVATAVLTVTEIPIASLIRDPAGAVCVGATVQFTDTSSGGPTSWLWDFGDTFTSTLQHPTHAYASTGVFTVTLSVSSAYGADVATGTVDVISTPAVSIDREPTGSVCVGASVTFTATNSGGPGSYLWSFSDGITATGQVVTHAYATSGVHTVWLTATNSCGVDVISTTVTVNPAPTASFTRDPAGDVVVGTTIQFTNTSSGGPTAWLWNFGDSFTSTLQHPTHAYAITGTFTISLTAMNTCGSDVATGTVNVLTGCVSPTITSLTSSSPVTQGQSMVFTATVAGTSPMTYTWDFGDSTPVVTGVGLATTSHDYASSGTYTVILTVTNACGFDSDTLVVTVNPGVVTGTAYLPLVLHNYPMFPVPTLILTADPLALLVGETSVLTATLFDTDGSPIAGTAVTFSTSDDLGSGALTPFGTTTNSDGQITATLRSTVVGLVQVTAQAASGESDSIYVVFRSATFCAPQLLAVAETGPEARDVALDTAGDRAFVAHEEGVTVIDTESYQLIAEVDSLTFAHGVAYDPDNDRVWVTTRAGGVGRVQVLDGTTYDIVADLAAGTLPHDVVYNPTSGRVYVTNYGSDSVGVYNAASVTLEQTLTDFDEPAHLAVNAVTNKVYAANHDPNQGVTVINCSTHATQRVLVNLIDAFGIAVDSTRNLVYVTSIEHARMSVISGTTDTYVGSMDIQRGGGQKVDLRVVEVNPNVGTEGHLWLTTSSADGGSYDQLLLMPNGWPTLGTPVPLDILSFPLIGIALDPDTDRIWVTNQSSAAVSVVQDGEPICSTPFSLSGGEEERYNFQIGTFAAR